jgi:hypothetical protein
VDVRQIGRDSVTIDVAIGLILRFLAVSLAASAVTEAISSALKWREATLLEGVEAWFIAVTSSMLVAASALFGASLWFDPLQRIVQLRGTGDEPKRNAGAATG